MISLLGNAVNLVSFVLSRPSKGAENNPHLFLERAGDLEPGGVHGLSSMKIKMELI